MTTKRAKGLLTGLAIAWSAVIAGPAFAQAPAAAPAAATGTGVAGDHGGRHLPA